MLHFNRSAKALRLLTFAALGGSLGYALYDIDARKYIEDQVYYTKDMFEKVFSNLPPRKDANKYIVFCTSNDAICDMFYDIFRIIPVNETQNQEIKPIIVVI